MLGRPGGGTLWWNVVVEHSVGTSWWNVMVEHCGGTSWWNGVVCVLVVVEGCVASCACGVCCASGVAVRASVSWCSVVVCLRLRFF